MIFSRLFFCPIDHWPCSTWWLVAYVSSARNDHKHRPCFITFMHELLIPESWVHNILISFPDASAVMRRRRYSVFFRAKLFCLPSFAHKHYNCNGKKEHFKGRLGFFHITSLWEDNLICTRRVYRSLDRFLLFL